MMLPPPSPEATAFTLESLRALESKLDGSIDAAPVSTKPEPATVPARRLS
jgi:hypothetical protein